MNMNTNQAVGGRSSTEVRAKPVHLRHEVEPRARKWQDYYKAAVNANDHLLHLNARLEQHLQERTAQLRALAAELTQVEERERQRLAQILHDHLQQLLFAAKLHLSGLHDQSTKPPIQRKFALVDGLLAQSIELSRSLAQELSPSVLHDFGLPAGLKWLSRWMMEKHGLNVVLVVDELMCPVDRNIQLWLFKAVRELLFNVVKHAGVKTAQVQMKLLSDRQLQIVVSDEGVGCDRTPLVSSSGGFGLQNIRQRLELFGGQFHMASNRGQGSRFTLLAPSQPVGTDGLSVFGSNYGCDPRVAGHSDRRVRRRDAA